MGWVIIYFYANVLLGVNKAHAWGCDLCLVSFCESVSIALNSCSWLTRLEPDVVFCCRRSSASKLVFFAC